MVSVGSYKVAWGSSDGKFLFSNIFKSTEREKAMAFANGLSDDWMLMKLIRRGNHADYIWTIEPEGSYEKYQAGLQGEGVSKREIVDSEKAVELIDLIVILSVIAYAFTAKNINPLIKWILISIALFALAMNVMHFYKYREIVK